MNMRAEFPFDQDADSNPNLPVCGYCNRTKAQHEPNDHIFDAVGGSLSAIDWRNGPPPIGVFAPVDIWAWIAKGLEIAAYAVMAWSALIFAGIAALRALHIIT